MERLEWSPLLHTHTAYFRVVMLSRWDLGVMFFFKLSFFIFVCKFINSGLSIKQKQPVRIMLKECRQLETQLVPEKDQCVGSTVLANWSMHSQKFPISWVQIDLWRGTSGAREGRPVGGYYPNTADKFEQMRMWIEFRTRVLAPDPCRVSFDVYCLITVQFDNN